MSFQPIIRCLSILSLCVSLIPTATQADATDERAAPARRARRSARAAAPTEPVNAAPEAASSRRSYVSHRREPNTSVVLPSLLMALGGAAMVAGGVAFPFGKVKDCSYDPCTLESPAAAPVGKGFMIGGAVLMTIGLVVLPVRLVARNRVALYSAASGSAQYSLAPWVDLKARRGHELGLMHTLTF